MPFPPPPRMPAPPIPSCAGALLAAVLVLSACGPAPEIELVCQDVVRSRCETFRQQWRNDPGLRGDEVERIVVRCVVLTCDESRGTVSIRAVLDDGSVHDLGSGGWRE